MYPIVSMKITNVEYRSGRQLNDRSAQSWKSLPRLSGGLKLLKGVGGERGDCPRKRRLFDLGSGHSCETLTHPQVSRAENAS